ncbi:MAG: superoxide dismutase family protein, partial [Clostridia bacterium]|nr:superoxide dismutase family protein [Clostridia bacterium]
TVVLTEVTGLPSDEGKCRGHIFGFHIHEGEKCSGNEKDPFAHTGTHYNPGECEHPNHAGDMPSLFGNGGIALSLFLTDRFSVREVIGRTAVIHSMPDDFTSQPSGNSGEKIACGEILRY